VADELAEVVLGQVEVEEEPQFRLQGGLSLVLPEDFDLWPKFSTFLRLI
jgi:hypothetical protein